MTQFSLNEVKSLSYGRPEISKGYTDHSLHINVADSNIEIRTIEDKIKELFIGGKGYDLWMLWNAVSGDTKWNDPENAVCIASGPLGGTVAYPGSGKSIVTTISPLTGAPIDSNVGGYFGPYLKFSGFDALEISGKALTDTVIFIDGINSKIQIFEANNLTDDSYELSSLLTKYFGQEKQGNISVVSTGPAAKQSSLGCLNFSWFDGKRKRTRYKQAGRGGIGTVFADKRIKAVVVRWDTVTISINQPADKETLKKITKLHATEIATLDRSRFSKLQISSIQGVS